ALETPERNRLPGPHGNPPKHLFDSELVLNATDEIVRADRDAAGGDDDVRLECVLECDSMCRLVVADSRHQLDVCTCSLELGRENQPVCLIDLARRENVTRAAKLGSRWQDGGARPACAPNLRNPGSGQCTQPRGCEQRAGFGDGLALMDVAAPRPDVG